MGLIGKATTLFDVGNCEAFVQRTIDKSAIEYGPHEREELLAEGLALTYELGAKYKPLPEPPCGYAAWFAMSIGDRQAHEAALHLLDDGVKRGRFSGHLAMFLPRRLGDAWHKAHAEHRYVTDPETGKRGWSYGPPMLSLDGITDSTSEQSQSDRLLLNAKGINAFCHATRAATQRLFGRAASRVIG